MQSRVYHWRPRPVDELDAIEVGTIRTTSASLSHLPLITADHHGQGTGLRRRLENDCRARALVAEAVITISRSAKGGGYVAPMLVAPAGPVPTLVGRQRCRTGIVARRSAEDLPPFRPLENAVYEAAQERSGRLAE